MVAEFLAVLLSERVAHDINSGSSVVIGSCEFSSTVANIFYDNSDMFSEASSNGDGPLCLARILLSCGYRREESTVCDDVPNLRASMGALWVNVPDVSPYVNWVRGAFSVRCAPCNVDVTGMSLDIGDELIHDLGCLWL